MTLNDEVNRAQGDKYLRYGVQWGGGGGEKKG